MTVEQLAASIYNDIQSGLAGHNANPTMSLEQLEDEITDMREAVIKELWQNGTFQKEDMMVAINCIDVDCADMNKCPCKTLVSKNTLHFEIPELLDSIGSDAIIYIGSTDRTHPFKVYFSMPATTMDKYRRNKKKRPYVYVERTKNSNGKYDCWIFNAPLVKTLCVIGIFKDLRDLEEYNCCNSPEYTDIGTISVLVREKLLKDKLQIYRQYLMQPHQTDLSPR